MKNTLCSVMALALVASIGCDRGNGIPGGSGFVEATSVIVSAETQGRLAALFVDEGDNVARGATIGIIDSTSVKLQIDRALAQRQSGVTATEIARIAIEQTAVEAALARKEFDRVASLVDKGSANRQQYDQSETRLKQAELAREHARATFQARENDVARIDAEIALLHRQLEDCYPSAPVSGIVVSKLTEPGELLAPGRPIVEIAKIDTVWVKVYLPARDLSAIRLGETASVDLEDGATAPLSGTVVWVSDEAEFTPKNVQTAEARADLVYAVKVNVANPQGVLKIGMPVMVRFSP
jgi:HlyD family secretion protein